MIRPCHARSRARRLPSAGPLLPAIALVLCLTSLAACSTSKLLVGAVYNRADDKALGTLGDWFDLTELQRRELEAYIGTFHTWHRRNELPRYAAMMREVATGLSRWNQATPADFEHWFERIDGLVQTTRDCHPARFITPLTHTLTDAQIDSLEQHRAEQIAQNRTRDADRSREQRIAERVDRIDTWIGRMGVELDDSQLQLLRDTFLQRRSLRSRYDALSDDWNTALFEIARNRDTPGYDAAMDAHIDSWFQQIEREYPEEYQVNRQNWLDFAVTFEKSLSKLQRRDMLSWLNNMADTLDAVSRDEPDWLPATDPSYGCIVDGSGAASG